MDLGIVAARHDLEKLLTDTDGQYVEVQSGRLFNQASETSSLTPFKQRSFRLIKLIHGQNTGFR